MAELFILSSMWAVAIGGTAWYCTRTAMHITYVTLADGRRQERRLPLIFRLLLPMVPDLTPMFDNPRFAQTRRGITRQLIASGFEGVLTAQEYLALRILVPVFLSPLLMLLLSFLLSSIPGRIGAAIGGRQAAFHMLAILYAVLYPGFWLKRAVRARHRSVQRALPFVLDLLTLSVEAGMDFMTAIRRIVERRKLDALGEEMIRVLREVQLGKTRREALQAMARRVDQLDVHAVVRALVQADELGVSIGTILRIQSDQTRTKRFERAEKLANEAPVKLIFPLVAFIFPAVFLMLLGPILMQILGQVF